MRPLAWLRARWRYVAALVAGFVAGLLLYRRLVRRRSTGARELGRAEGRAREVADNLHGEAADLRERVEVARERDAAEDAAREARADAAAAAVPEVPPTGWRDPPDPFAP